MRKPHQLQVRWVTVWLIIIAWILSISNLSTAARSNDNQSGEQGWARITKRTQTHILDGDFNRDGTFKSGLHYLLKARELAKSGKISLKEFKKAPNGVTQGQIDGKFKTFFPEEWSKEKILKGGETVANEVKRLDKIDNEGKFEGVYEKVKIEGYLNPDTGEIKSFWPRWPQ
jgi:hypothetical protein